MTKKTLWIYIFLSTFCASLSRAQDTGEIKLGLKDQHTAAVTAAVVHPSEDYLITGDASGKILMYSTQDYRFIKTISPGFGLPVSQLMFTDDSFLLSAKKSEFPSEAVSDSVIQYNINSLQQKPIISERVTFHNPPSDGGTVVSIEAPENFYSEGLVYVDNSKGEKNFSLEPDKKIIQVAFPKEGNQLVLLTSDYRADFIEIWDRHTGKQLWVKEMPLRVKLKHIEFDPGRNGYLVMVLNQNTDEIQVQFLDAASWGLTPATQWVKLPFFDIELTATGTASNRTWVVTSTGAYSSVAALVNLGPEDINIQEVELETPANLGIYIPSREELVFWKSFDPLYDNTVNFAVYSKAPMELLQKFPTTGQGKYRGIFLSGDNWMVTGNDNRIGASDGYSSNLKYFESGTFKNRFGKLHFRDYFFEYFAVDLLSSTAIFLDEVTGEIGFKATAVEETYTGRSSYYSYDLIGNKMNEIAGMEDEYFQVVAYNGKKDHFLVSTQVTAGGGYQDLRPFRLVSGSKQIDLPGSYLQGIFSGDGNFVLSLDDKDQLQIYDINLQKTVFAESFGSGTYKLFPSGEQGFIVSWRSSLIDTTCGKKTMNLKASATGSFSKEIQDCVFLEDLDFKNGVMAGVNDTGLAIVNGKPLYSTGGEVPMNISLNEAGTKAMLSFKSGIIKILKVATGEVVGTMYHPDRNSHLFFNRENRYFSNIDPSEYLLATVDGDAVPFNEAKHLFDPEALLRLFGEPKPSYVEALRKAMEHRNANLEVPVAGTRPEIEEVWINGTKNTQIVTSPSVEIKVETEGKGAGVSDLKIRLNGINYSDMMVKKKDGVFSFELPLQRYENEIEITAVDSKQAISFPIVKKVLFQGDFQKPDLYVLSIGVSDYQQSAFDLTFADKDAMDIARMYKKEISEEEQRKYQDQFLGKRYHLKGNVGTVSEIRFFEGLYSSFTELVPLDSKGRFWLKYIDQEQVQLWDFDSEEISDLHLPETFSLDIYGDEVIFPKPEADGFYFRTTDGELYEYSFEERKYRELELPFTLQQLQEKHIQFYPLEKGQWLTYENVRTDKDSVSLTIVSPKGKTWKENELSFTLDGYNLPEPCGVSQNGEHLLLKIMAEGEYQLLMTSMVEGKVNTLLIPGITPEYGEVYQIAPDGKSFSEIVEKVNEQGGKSVVHKIYNTEGTLVHSNDLSASGNTLVGLNNYSGEVIYIEEQAALAAGSYFDAAGDEMGAAKPASFENTYVHSLTNQFATAKEIEKSLETFLSNSRPQDQIIVFFAGHGVLDTENQYYYAPHDMDFAAVATTGVSFNTILEGMTASPALNKLLLMDTCHAGNTFDSSEGGKNTVTPIAEGQRGSEGVSIRKNEDFQVSDIIATLFDNFRSTSGITILSASSGEDVAYETKDLGNGAFTTAYINNIKERLSNLGLYLDEEKLKAPVPLTEELIYEIQKEVIGLTNKKQVPDIREINPLAKIKLW